MMLGCSFPTLLEAKETTGSCFLAIYRKTGSGRFLLLDVSNYLTRFVQNLQCDQLPPFLGTLFASVDSGRKFLRI